MDLKGDFFYPPQPHLCKTHGKVGKVERQRSQSVNFDGVQLTDLLVSKSSTYILRCL